MVFPSGANFKRNELPAPPAPADDLPPTVMVWSERIVVEPEILVGRSVIPGTRLPVEFIQRLPATRIRPQAEMSEFFVHRIDKCLIHQSPTASEFVVLRFNVPPP